LLSAFSFEQRAFGQSVSSSEIIALIQDVEGVYAVELAFLSTDHTRQYHEVLHASMARVEGQQIKPAQLLLIDASDEGIDLQWKGQNA
jgi:phage-related baseplate assembly protein